MKKSTNDKRSSIISAVHTPLGFFALVSLIVEAVLGTLTLNLTGHVQVIALYGMIVTLIFLILVVALIGLINPQSLIVSEVSTEYKNDNTNDVIDEDTLYTPVALYEYLSFHRVDRLFLDGSRVSNINIKMIINGEFNGYTDSMTPSSKDIFPISKFNIEVLSFESSRDVDVYFEIIDDGPRKKWKFVIDPPLREGDYLNYSVRLFSQGSQVMCLEDLIEVAKINKNVDSLSNKIWRNLAVPTNEFYWKLIFPEGYKITNMQPCVMRIGKRIKKIEDNLENEQMFKRYNDNDACILELILKRPLIFYSYGFAWIPPSKDEYINLCERHNIKPYHGTIG